VARVIFYLKKPGTSGAKAALPEPLYGAAEAATYKTPRKLTQ
jgi:hypothetical protein